MIHLINSFFFFNAKVLYRTLICSVYLHITHALETKILETNIRPKWIARNLLFYYLQISYFDARRNEI